MNLKENIYAGLDERLDNEIIEKLSIGRDYYEGKEIDINRLIELEKSVIRLTQLQRENNLILTKKILKEAITPLIEEKLNSFELTTQDRSQGREEDSNPPLPQFHQ